jgi:hypothetical protein
MVAQRGEALFLEGEKTPHGRFAREKSESVGISIQDFVMVVASLVVRARVRVISEVSSQSKRIEWNRVTLGKDLDVVFSSNLCSHYTLKTPL